MMSSRRGLLLSVLLPLMVLFASPAFAGFSGTDLILPASGRVLGAGGSEFLTTGWVTNPGDEVVDVQFQFLEAGQANLNPLTVTDTLSPGQTKTYENLAETLFGRVGVLGGVRVRSSARVLASARIYSQAPGDMPADTNGVYFAAVPSSFAIGQNEQGSLQGVSNNADFRYNFFVVEVSGAETLVEVSLRDGSGADLATKTYSLRPWEQMLVSTSDLAPGIVVNGGRIDATVVSELGRAIFAGSLVTNGSQDSTGFEMSFKSDLLAENSQRVISLNDRSGVVTLTGGPGVTITPSGNNINIDATGAIGPGGPAGPAGPMGQTGPAGATGPAGPAGATGPAGPVGPAGPAGATGPAGPVGPTGPAGATGPEGPIGPIGPAGATGPEGPVGPIGPAGATGPEGPVGATGSAGADGAAGPTGAPGADGATGPAGPVGPAGPAGGLADYAYIYNGGFQVVAVEDDVTFDTAGIMTAGIAHVPGTAPITIVNAGIYEISFIVSGVEPNQFALFVNGTPAAGSIYGSGAGTQQNSGRLLIALSAGDVVTLRNHSSAAAVTLQFFAGGTQVNVNASVLMRKLN